VGCSVANALSSVAMLSTGQHVPEDDIDKVIESGEAENIFQKATLYDQVRMPKPIY
jgi:hypothetical protein